MQLEHLTFTSFSPISATQDSSGSVQPANLEEHKAARHNVVLL